jgi:hypothetical protein
MELNKYKDDRTKTKIKGEEERIFVYYFTTQPLTEMSTRNLPGGKGRPSRKADNLTAI